MKKTSLISALGMVILTVVGFIFTKANKAYYSPTSCHFGSVAGTFMAPGHLTLVKGASGKSLYLCIPGAASTYTAITVSMGVTQVYYVAH